MAYRIAKSNSQQAAWGLRISLFAIQLLILTWLLHRFASLYTPAAINLFGFIILSTIVALLLSIWGLFRIWNRGQLGLGKAIAGILISTVIILLPLSQIPQAWNLPGINDITTDIASPPSFQTLASSRPNGSNSTFYPGTEFAEAQIQAYPYIRPVQLNLAATTTFEVVQKAVKKLGWRIVATQVPTSDGRPGRIEAVDKTLFVGFVDDVSVRVRGVGNQSRIDIRSASRFGSHDLGRNAYRINLLINEINEAIETGEILPQTRPRNRR